MKTEFDAYNYIVCIDLGTTFSGSCYVDTQDKETIFHVTKWPDQSDTFEKTPTVCLYDKTTIPPKFIKWGNAAVNHVANEPDDPNVLLVSEFKLKLFHDTSSSNNNQLVSWKTAAIDYLRAIHEYTIKQLLQRHPTVCIDKEVRYVLTIPATWVQDDNVAMHEIAAEAGLLGSVTLNEAEQNIRLSLLSEAHAASLFCEREYNIVSVNSKGETVPPMTKGQRYLVCDAGGGTIDLATYECTESKENHCQLALESGGSCGATILDRNMQTYLREKVFHGCEAESIVKILVEQFKRDVKHHFGDDTYHDINRIALPTAIVDQKPSSSIDNITETKVPIEMIDVEENDYDYEGEYENYDSDTMMEDQDNDSQDMDHQSEDSGDDEDYSVLEDAYEREKHIYLTLPPAYKSMMDEFLVDCLTINKAKQIQISYSDICKYVFDPVVDDVISLIHKQINKSYTTIDTIFLLGGFGQSPYLYKKLHEEFITNTNKIMRLVVPRDGYRAAMRGGIHYGLDCSKAIPEFHFKSQYGDHLLKSPDSFRRHVLVGIVINYSELSATYSWFFDGENGSPIESFVDTSFATNNPYVLRKFMFDSRKFMATFGDTLLKKLGKYRSITTIFSLDFYENEAKDVIYSKLIFSEFIQAMISHIKNDIMASCPDKLSSTDLWFSIEEKLDKEISASFCKTLLEETTFDADEWPIITLLREISTGIERNYTPFAQAHEDILNDFIIEVILSGSDVDSFKDRRRALNQAIRASFESKVQTRIWWCCSSKYIYYRQKYSHQHPFDLFIFRLSHAVSISNSSIPPSLLSKRKSNSVLAYSFNSIQSLNSPNSKTLFYNKASLDNMCGTDHDSPRIIRIQMLHGVFYMKDLMTIIGKDADFKSSQHVREYIKSNVDLSRPDETHKIEDIFMDAKGLVVPLAYQENSEPMRPVVEQCLNIARLQSITTLEIEQWILKPWITYTLVPTIVRSYNEWKTVGASPAYFVFAGEIIDTKYQGEKMMRNSTLKCSEYLFEHLRRDLEAAFYSKETIHVEHRKEISEDIVEQAGCLIECYVTRSCHYKPLLQRVARKTYAMHFLKYKTQQKSISSLPPPRNTEEDLSTPHYSFVDLQDTLSLQPLVKQDSTLTPSLDYLAGKKFFVKDECLVAAVLYASDVLSSDEEFLISNTNFKKLHRFVIPVKDPTKPICVTFRTLEYSLLFTVCQDNYKADFRCNDLMYLIK